VEAAIEAAKKEATRDDFDVQVTLNSIPKHPITIQTEHQQYLKPFTMDQVCEFKSEFPEALIVNGATDVGLMVTKQNKLLRSIIDISDVEELKQITETDEFVSYGAGLNLETIFRHCETLFPSMYEMLKVFGSRQIRTMGTIGGNVANASPIGDTPPVLLSLNAKVELESLGNARVLDLEEFITGYRTTQLEPHEVIKSVIIPKAKSGVTHKAYKISKRKDLDISTVSGGFSVELDEAANVKHIDLFYGGMAAQTLRAEKAESFLTGKSWNRENVELAMPLIDEQFTPITDARSSKEGRTVMARNLLMKFWSETQG